MTQDQIDEGYVYILSNPVMPGIVKIGFTTQDDINVRLSSLFSTGVPVPFDVEYACRIPNYKTVERALHRAFQPQRVHDGREFFYIEPFQAISILELFETIDFTSDVIRISNENAPPEDKVASKKSKKRRPNFNFLEMGFKEGDAIQFNQVDLEAAPIIAHIATGRTVRFEDENYSLTALTRKLLNKDYDVQPGSYWITPRGSLNDLYEETYV